MQTLKKKDIKNFKPKLKEEFASKKQQRYFYAKANDDSLSDEERGKWKKWAEEYSDDTDFDSIPDEVEEVESLDELVTNVGGEIGGDEKKVSNSEIRTAPQATSDEFNTKAIQPNRYLYNVNSVGPRVMGVTAEQKEKIAKEKAIALLENIWTDSNKNEILDTNELPDSVSRKMVDLVNSVEANGINKDPEKIQIILDFIKTNLEKNA
jgi:hypothetical protein